MSRFMSGLVSAGLCLAMMTACGDDEQGLSVTLYGRIESLSDTEVTLQTGEWENDTFVANEESPTITVNSKTRLSSRASDASTLQQLQPGCIIKFTLCVGIDGEEKITSLEIMQSPG